MRYDWTKTASGRKMGWFKRAQSAPSPAMVEDKQINSTPTRESKEDKSKDRYGDDHPCRSHMNELLSIIKTVLALEPRRNSKMIEIFSQWSSKYRREFEKMGIPTVPPFSSGGVVGFDPGEGSKIRSKIIALGKSWLTAVDDGRCTELQEFVRSFDSLQAFLGRMIALAERYSR